MSRLFRKEVIDKQAQRHLGDVFLSTPLSFWAITGLIAIIMAGLIVVALFGEYARKERVLGVLVPSKGLVQIVPTQSGVIEEVYVDAGHIVDVGDPLLKIIFDVGLVGGKTQSIALMKNLAEEKQNIRQHLLEIPQHYILSKNRLADRKVSLAAETERAQVQIEYQIRSVSLEKSIFERLRKLFKDEAASALEVTSQESRYLSSLQSLSVLKNNKQKLLANIKDIDAQIALLPHEQEDEENGLKSRLSSLEQNIIRTNASGSSIIRAPIAGQIAISRARKGQPAVFQKPLLTILPSGEELQVELFVPTRAAGFIRPGQTVRLLYDAFPYQKFGFFDGEITQVSKSVIRTANITDAPQLNEPVFLITVIIDKQFIDIRGEQFPLQAGMTLSADLILEDRKIWEWAFEPLLGAIK